LSFREKDKPYRRREDPSPHALPVFSVDTLEEAKHFEVYCIHMYDGRMRWTPGFGGWVPGDVDTLDGVTEFMRNEYERMKLKEGSP
jgi:hypothetical protein